jgi:hypothetical protein
MFDFEVNRCTRQCAKTERQLLPGETIYSVLLPDGSEIKRLDYAADAWQEPPETAIAWWKSQLPGANAKRVHWAPNEVILDYFDRLQSDEAKADVRYVLTLLMIRRRIMRIEHVERDESGNEIIVVYSPRQELEHRVPVVMPTGSRATEIQNELSTLLVTPAA